MGALVGGAYVTGITVDSAIVIAEKTGLKDLFQYVDLGIPTTGLISGDKISEFLSELYGNKKFEELSIPFAVTAADIYSGKSYVISKGDVTTAVRTSISIPVVFETVIYGDILLVDGGLTDPVPIDITREMGADFIIAVNVLARPIHENPYTDYISADSIKAREKSKFSFSFKDTGVPQRNLINENRDLMRIIQNTVAITQARIAEFQVQLGQPDLIIEPDMTSIHAWEFHKGQDAIEIGYKTAWQALYKYHQGVIRMDQRE